MELRHLISFIAVADTHNMTVAAQRCNLTPGAVSHHIIALEKELGVKLFERKAKEMLLTEQGNAFVKRARNAVKELQEGCEDISNNGELSGELRIGVGSFIEPYIRRTAIEFMRRFPKVLLRVNFDSAAVLNKMLRNEELDLAFTMNTPYHYEGITHKPCIPFRLSCIMPSTNPLADKESVTFDEIMGCRVIMPDVGERVFQTFQRYCTFDISKLPVAAIVGNPDAACKALIDADCVTFLPSEYGEEYSHVGLVAKPIDTLDMELMSNAHWLKSNPLKASAKAFLDIIKELNNR